MVGQMETVFVDPGVNHLEGRVNQLFKKVGNVSNSYQGDIDSKANEDQSSVQVQSK